MIPFLYKKSTNPIYYKFPLVFTSKYNNSSDHQKKAQENERINTDKTIINPYLIKVKHGTL